MITIDHGGHGEARSLRDCDESLIDSVLTCVTNVHRNLGLGLFEPVYELAATLERWMTLQQLLRIKRGFLINFNKPLLKDGIKRVSI